MSLLNNKIGKLENHKGWGDFEHALKGDITYNAKIKNIICRLSAMLEEDYKTSDESQIEKIRKSLLKLQLTLNTSSPITIATEINEKIFGVNGRRTLTQLAI
jgi:hypothetical protein